MSILLFVVSCKNGGATIGTPPAVRKVSEVAVCRVRVRGEVTIKETSEDRGWDCSAAERAGHWVSRPRHVRRGSWIVKSRGEG